MARLQRQPPPTAFELIPTTFQAGAHTLTVAMLQDRRWKVAVDGTPVTGSFMTQVEAWEVGVREAARLG